MKYFLEILDDYRFLCESMKSTARLPTPRRGRSGVPAARRKARKRKNGGRVR